MTEKERHLLIAIARQSIEEALTGKASDAYQKAITDPPASLCTDEGAFVTLKHRANGALRGCIGNIIGAAPLYELVRRLARESAFHDPRFSPVRLAELAHLRIEISVLSVPTEIERADQIMLGRDGVILTCGMHRALFLPQVAPEQGWDRDTMLDHLAAKAGLPPQAWKQPNCHFSVFQAQVYEED